MTVPCGSPDLMSANIMHAQVRSLLRPKVVMVRNGGIAVRTVWVVAVCYRIALPSTHDRRTSPICRPEAAAWYRLEAACHVWALGDHCRPVPQPIRHRSSQHKGLVGV